MFIESLHTIVFLKKGDLFLRYGQKNTKIGKVKSGVLRAFIINDDKEITTHFYEENDIVSGNYVPDTKSSIYIQALEDCSILTANFSEVMSCIYQNKEVTELINTAFQKLNARIQSRLVALTNLSSLEKYSLFLKEYPSLINRVPHYYIADFLGITPYQLSRVRKKFSQNR
ncbi:Crp/Fnr family transcriptional regulator [Aquimarina aquimarini]|uniref:Crp/Fnr family transcriptional regulator n=1 Tax=Aquimarina aquimarini TaxID=1191734 RepID=UPI000D5557C2|nr:Crp/Fnr family transcriptional regulator [Aquimarina aquimarini]